MKHSNRSWMLILGVLALLVMISGCKNHPPPTPPPPPPKPVTATLTATPSSIQRGQSSTLTWSTENADTVTLEGSPVNASGSQSVSPTSTTTYHLAAKGAAGTQEATAQVTVTEPPPPPPPPPTPKPTDDEIFNQSVHDIYFDFDKYDLRPESVQSLAQTAQVLSQHPTWVVQIEGNCDERGSAEYNIGLGTKRANAAKDALLKSGVSANQLKSISYGKERPVCTEATEDCWQKNRHDHFVLVH
ncbi:MAG TPA: peptidoglycan-associated lipoprotein Pal [Alphaproteobacteria bacterium]|nr:peptidoglycan-associated lipoprotein Pal [Alphaproteobacteria bacterium]